MKKVIVGLFCVILSISSSGTALAAGGGDSVETIRAKVKKFYASKKKVVVTTKFGDKTRGHVVRVDPDEFAIREKNGNEVVYQYSKVDKVNRSGGLSTGSIVGIAAGGVAAVIVLAFLGKRLNS
ncbi:MAG: hypothetical protein ABL984_06815 [Pyrinomonadaceae bacterium]